MGDRVEIYDTTLRDGCQGAGISLALQDKLDVARRLDELGVDYIEGGWPGSNPKDEQFFAAARGMPLRHARVSAFGSTRRPGTSVRDDRNLELLLEAETPVVALVAKAWDFHVQTVLRASLDENLAMVADSVGFLKAHGREVIVDAEHFFDGYRAHREYALAVLRAAVQAGADRLVLCDTNGGSLPPQVTAAVTEVVAGFEVGVGIHAHNDGELAVANTLAAVDAGARHVQGTINGYGERIGNANLCSVIPNLVLKLGYACTAGDRLAGLSDLSAFVDDVANLPPNPRLPFVGFAAFAHKGGIHVQAVAHDPATYEHVDPAQVGNARRILVSELSGRRTIVQRARELGLALDDGSELAATVVARIKELESQGFQFEDADASFALLVRRADPSYRPPFEPVGYTVASWKDDRDHGSRSSAAAEVRLDGDVLRGEAIGTGPVDALEKAMRRALVPAFPYLADVTLTDFRSQIARGRDGARGAVRVRITGSAPEGTSWTSVGSSADLLHATWVALVDCMEHAVLAAERAAVPAARTRPQPPPLAVVADILAPAPSAENSAVLEHIASIDWRRTTLDLAEPSHRATAAHAVALGAALFYSFGNFCAIAAHPAWESVRRVNLLKGRPENQVGSVTTTRDRVEALFEWRALPQGVTRERVLELIDAFYALGPMGFRGPAAYDIPRHLTSLDADQRTTQVIGPGYRCPSNELLDEALARIGTGFLFITSANVSSGVTGRVEPAHYDLRGMQADFGDRDGIVLIGHDDEAAVRVTYPEHLPMSTSIVAFHTLATDETGRAALVLERHGSLAADDVRALVHEHGFGLVYAEGALERLPLRDEPAFAG